MPLGRLFPRLEVGGKNDQERYVRHLRLIDGGGREAVARWDGESSTRVRHFDRRMIPD
jgi:hypothetical protein